jgi:hypothetical protein
METTSNIPAESNYFLENTSDAVWDSIVLFALDPEELKGEQNLYKTKWWDYRPEHPGKATMLYAQAFYVVYRQAVSIGTGLTPDSPLSNPRLNPFEEADVRIKAFWRGRRKVDELGIPYDFHMYQAASYLTQFIDRPLRPQDMYRIDALEKSQERWELLTSTGYTRFPVHEDYRIRYNWRNAKHQQQWEDYLTEKLKRAPHSVVEFHQTEFRDYLRHWL